MKLDRNFLKQILYITDKIKNYNIVAEASRDNSVHYQNLCNFIENLSDNQEHYLLEILKIFGECGVFIDSYEELYMIKKYSISKIMEITELYVVTNAFEKFMNSIPDKCIGDFRDMVIRYVELAMKCNIYFSAQIIIREKMYYYEIFSYMVSSLDNERQVELVTLMLFDRSACSWEDTTKLAREIIKVGDHGELLRYSLLHHRIERGYRKYLKRNRYAYAEPGDLLAVWNED